MEQATIFDQPVQEAICSYLTFPEAVQLREALCRSKLDCPLSIEDKDQQIKSLPYVDSMTIEIYSLIEKCGSKETLIYAIDGSNYSMVKFLLEKGANANTVTFGVNSPLIEAITRGNYEIVKLLLENGAKHDFHPQYQGTPFSTATHQKKVEITRLLLQFGVNPESYDLGKVFMDNYQKTIDLIFEFKLDLTHLRYQGMTLLIIAIRNGNIKTVKLLLKNGVDINDRDAVGDTALLVAVNRNQVEVVELLLDYGADVHLFYNRQTTVLMVANERHFHYLAKLLKEAGA